MPSPSTAALHHLHSLVALPFPLFTGDDTSSVRDPTHARQFRLDSDNMAVPDGGTFIAPCPRLRLGLLEAVKEAQQQLKQCDLQLDE